MKKTNDVFFLTLILMSLIIGQNVSSAHAFLDHAEPAVGSQVVKTPDRVRLWFTEKVEPAFSSIKVTDASGKEIDKNDQHVDSKDQSVMVVSLPTLTPGTYQVFWKVVAEDTHTTQGSFRFTLK